MENFEVDSRVDVLAKVLAQNGADLYVVGGAIRDYYYGLHVSDYDCVTNIPYEKALSILEKHFQVKEIGKKYGVLSVLGLELATMRVDCYSGTEKTKHTENIEHDMQRRDFTINSVYYNVNSQEFIYSEEAQKDLECSVLSFIGIPEQRIAEDSSRLLRAALMLSIIPNSSINPVTEQAIKTLAHKSATVPYSLQGKIIKKAIDRGVLHKFVYWLNRLNLLRYILPELHHTVELPQNDLYHKFDVFNHTLKVMEEMQSHLDYTYKNNEEKTVMMLTALYHDCAKGLDEIRTVTENKISDIGHERAGAEIAQEAIIRLGFGKTMALAVKKLIYYHGVFETSEKATKKFLRKLSKSYTSKIELELAASQIVAFREADLKGMQTDFSNSELKKMSQWRMNIKQTLQENIYYPAEFQYDANQIYQQFHKPQRQKVKEWLLINNIKTQQQAKTASTRVKKEIKL